MKFVDLCLYHNKDNMDIDMIHIQNKYQDQKSVRNVYMDRLALPIK